MAKLTPQQLYHIEQVAATMAIKNAEHLFISWLMVYVADE